MKLLVVSDPHIVTHGEAIVGLDPAQRLDAVLKHAMAHQGDADHLVVLGDLTHHGKVAEYQRFSALLAQVEMPYTLMMGNHDRRAGFAEVFGGEGFAHAVVELGTHRLICLDTLDESAVPRHSGYLCAARLNWLRARLAESEQPVVLALHHPCFETGFSGMDRIRLRNDDALFELVAQSGRVVQLLCGHVHRTISGTARGVPFAVFKSSCHQMPMMLGISGSGHSIDELGAYGVVLLGAQGVTVHNVDVGGNAPVSSDSRSD